MRRRRVVWRDDDVLQVANGTLADLLRVDDLFQRHGVRHTVAVLACTLTDDLTRVLVDRRMDVQLHGWDHDNHAVDMAACARLGAAADLIGAAVGTRPTVFYPPFNHASPGMRAAAAAQGLAVSTRHVTLPGYLAGHGDPANEVVNFHYWSAPERRLLARALRQHVGLSEPRPRLGV